MSESYVGNTGHGESRAEKRGFTPQDVEQAIESAKQADRVTMKLGKYGTPQLLYEGSNGLTAVIETAGKNSGKLITAWWRQE